MKEKEQDKKNYPFIYKVAQKQTSSLEQSIREKHVSDVLFNLYKGQKSGKLPTRSTLTVA